MNHVSNDQRSVTLLAVVAVSLSLILLGYFVFWLVPPASPAEIARNAQDILAGPRVVQPEPQEKATYFTLLLALVPLLFVATAAARRFRRPLGPLIERSAVLVAVAIGATLLACDLFWERQIAAASQSWSTWVLTGGAVILATALALPRVAPPVRRAVARVILGAALVAGAVITVCWRIFDVHSVDAMKNIGHFEAVAYSVAQISNGGTCLVDVIPQYGCYGEFMAPLVRALGVSTLAITLVFTVFQLIAFVGLVIAARRLVKEPLILALLVLMLVPVTNRIWYGTDDQFFQGMPVRMLFPALSLLVARAWLDSPTARRAFLVGAFGGLATMWNLDTGAVVVTALAGLVWFAGCTASGWRWTDVAERVGRLAACGAGVAIVIAVALAVLRWKASAWPSVTDYLLFQQVFFGLGAYSLPMSPFPALWSAFAGAAVVALGLMAARFGEGPADRDLELMGFLAVLALGLMSYHVGRSHWHTLALVSWPFLLLILALLDRAWRTVLKPARGARLLGQAALAVALAWAIAIVVQELPKVAERTAEQWARWSAPGVARGHAADVEYVRAAVPAGESVVIVARRQTALFADTGLRSAITGMSWIETLRKSDGARQAAQFLDKPVDHLLLDATQCCPFGGPGWSTWVYDAMPAIREKYAMIAWTPTGTLAHLVPRARKGPRRDLFEEQIDPGSEVHAVWDKMRGFVLVPGSRPLGDQRRWWFRLDRDFHVEIRFSMAAQQVRHAVLLSTYSGSPHGLAVEMDAIGRDANIWIGTGEAMHGSPPFRIEPDVQHVLVLTSRDGRVRLLLDGRIVFDAPNLEMKPSANPVVLGAWYGPGRDMTWTVSEVRFTFGDAPQPP